MAPVVDLDNWLPPTRQEVKGGDTQTRDHDCRMEVPKKEPDRSRVPKLLVPEIEACDSLWAAHHPKHPWGGQSFRRAVAVAWSWDCNLIHGWRGKRHWRGLISDSHGCQPVQSAQKAVSEPALLQLRHPFCPALGLKGVGGAHLRLSLGVRPQNGTCDFSPS